jgi:hypothetical protein
MQKSVVIALASVVLNVACSGSPNPATSPSLSPARGLPTVAPSSEEECREKVSIYLSEPPDPEELRGIVPSDRTDEAVDYAYDLSIGWTGVIAEIYQCSVDFGSIPGGDTVLAQHASVLYLVDLALDDAGIRAVIDSAMVGIQQYYADGCFRPAADLWLETGSMDLDQMSECG